MQTVTYPEVTDRKLSAIVMLGIKSGVVLIAALRNWPTLSAETHRRIMLEAAITWVHPALIDEHGFTEIAMRFRTRSCARYMDQDDAVKPLTPIEQVMLLSSIETAIKTAVAMDVEVGIGRDDINHMLMFAASFGGVGIDYKV